ncbi:MAG: hypothetical protein GX598_01075 [Elusimicrobia bacterium]|nr:hypothetical protein [Elusimicrobiota bacterium]
MVEMIALFISGNEENVLAALSDALGRTGNTAVSVVKREVISGILQKGDMTALVSLEEKIRKLSRQVCMENKGRAYKIFLDTVEKPLFEEVLIRTDGNQMKAARILGINRNTMRSRIKRLGLTPGVYRQ